MKPKNIKKANGLKKNVVEKAARYEHYKEALFEKRQFWHRTNILRSEGHEIYCMHENKVSISLFDTKHWMIDDGMGTMAYRHKDIKKQ